MIKQTRGMSAHKVAPAHWHIMKAQWGHTVKLSHILDLGIR